VNYEIFGVINERFLSKKLFGIFDMRITRWEIMMWIAALLCLAVFIPLARRIKKAKYGSRSRWVNFWEVLISFVHDEIVEPNFDHHYVKKAMPYFLSIFFFVLFCNLLGLLPGMSTATGNLAVTGGLAVLTLLGMLGVGMVKQGVFRYWAGLVPHGVPAFVLPLMFPIEIIGLFIKPFALTVRLFANMTAGHVVIIIFIYLVMMFQNYWVGIGSVTGSLMIYLLELLVSFIQAYIFATLSAMFIGASMHAH
jgi:F-type H+-transporting ATPase subunit a